MVASVISDNESALFISKLNVQIRNEGDFYIGVVDETTDTAVGVMAVIDDTDAQGSHRLEITYIYVSEEHRGRGAGRAMMELVFSIAKDIRADFILCISDVSTEDAGIFYLLKDFGFMEIREARVTNYEAFLSDIRFSGKIDETGVVPLATLSEYQWRSIETRLVSLLNDDEPGLRSFVRSRSYYDQDISFAKIAPDGKIQGVLLLALLEDTIFVDVGRGIDGEEAMDMLGLLKSACKEATGLLSGDTKVVVSPYTKAEKDLLLKLTEGRIRKVSDTVCQICIL